MGSGRSLAPAVGEDATESGLAGQPVFTEVFDQRSQLAVLQRRDEGLFQYFSSQLVAEPDGTWVTRSATFDLAPGASIEAVSFAEARIVSVTVDGESRGDVEVGGGWTPLGIELAETARRVTLSTAECSVPLFLGVGNDSRCLSFKVRGAELRRVVQQGRWAVVRSRLLYQAGQVTLLGQGADIRHRRNGNVRHANNSNSLQNKKLRKPIGLHLI